MEKVWQEALAEVTGFVGGVETNLIPSADPALGQSVDYAAIFGPYFPHANNAVIFGTPLEEFDSSVSSFFIFDFNFSLSSIDPTGFSASFGDDNFGSITQVDSLTGTYLFDMNGMNLVGDWHEGAPPVDPEDIVITGHRNSDSSYTTTGYFLFSAANNGFNFHDGFGGGAGGGGGGRTGVPYTPAGNRWANAHIHLIGTTQADVHAWNVMHDDLAKFYDWASANPNALIQIGNGTTVTASTALADFNQVAINIQSTGGGDFGGEIQPNTTGGAVITINPENSSLATEHSQYGDSIYNFSLFHELGHALDNVEAHSMYLSVDSEAFANAGARSMENFLGILLPQFPNNTPPFGYR